MTWFSLFDGEIYMDITKHLNCDSEIDVPEALYLLFPDERNLCSIVKITVNGCYLQ